MCHHEGVSTSDTMRKVPVGGGSRCHGAFPDMRFFRISFHMQRLLPSEDNYRNRHTLLWNPPCSKCLPVPPLFTSPYPPPLLFLC